MATKTEIPAFVQIAAARRYNHAVPFLYAVDDHGYVWEHVWGYDYDSKAKKRINAWVRLTDRAVKED